MPNSSDPSRCHPLREVIDDALRCFLPSSCLPSSERLNDALHYAVFPGGKRMRPILTLLAARVAGATIDEALPAACAIEFLHTSSLIFDDLPAMDDAALRRGSASLHLVFGEDVALLAALALLNQAYAFFGSNPCLIAEAVACIGSNGMIGGQALDLGTHARPVSFTARNRKTSSLMRLTMVAGAMASHAPADAVHALGRAGELLGEAYQVGDDLLDLQQDARHQRPSHVASCGPDACFDHVASLINQTQQVLESHFGHTECVGELLSNIDQIVSGFRRAGVVTACF